MTRLLRALIAQLVASVAVAAPLSIPQSPGTKTFDFTMGSLDATDGVQCALATSHQINSGPIILGATCVNNANGALYFHADMPAAYSGGTIAVTLVAEHETASPSGNLSMDVSCMCRAPGDVINSSWGSSQAATVALSVQYRQEAATTVAITCNGTCKSNSTIYGRAVINTGNTTANSIASLYIIGMPFRFPVNSLSD